MLRLVTSSTMKRRGETSDDHPQKHPRRDVCNWCATRPRMVGKPYCQVCATRGRECRGCHRPMPTKYFDGDANVCKTCVSKYNRQQTTRKNNITTFGDVLLEKTCTEVAENPDLRTFLAARQEAICEDIAQALIEKHGIKAYLVIYIQLSRHGNDSDKVTTTVPLRSDVMTIMHESSFYRRALEYHR